MAIARMSHHKQIGGWSIIFKFTSCRGMRPMQWLYVALSFILTKQDVMFNIFAVHFATALCPLLRVSAPLALAPAIAQVKRPTGCLGESDDAKTNASTRLTSRMIQDGLQCVKVAWPGFRN